MDYETPVTVSHVSPEPEAMPVVRPPLRSFLSYSHHDKSAKNIFEKNLSVMQRKNLITPWHDGMIEPGAKGLMAIQENLEVMDIFIGLLTTAFLDSDFIEKIELKAAREKLRRDGRDFHFVLILVDDISLTQLDLADYQILKPGGKAVTQHKSRKDGFNQAQKELDKWIIGWQAEKQDKHRGP